jgi:hypothetical protein
MGVMKRRLLFAIALMAFLTVPARAAVTVEQATDAEYLINAGYSQATAEDVFMLKNRANGKPIEPLYENTDNKFVKYVKRFFAYVDPGRETEDRIHHDIKMSPSYTDL